MEKLDLIEKEVLYLDNEQLLLIEKYGFPFGFLISKIRKLGYEIPNFQGELIDADECSDLEIINYLNMKEKVVKRLTSKYDVIEIYAMDLNNSLIKQLEKISDIPILLYGILNEDVILDNFIEFLSKDNIFYRFDRIIDARLLNVINDRDKAVIVYDESIYSFYINESNLLSISNYLNEINKFIQTNKNNANRKVDIIIEISDIQILTSVLPSFISDVQLDNSNINFEFRLSKHSEQQISKNYASFINAEDILDDFRCNLVDSNKMSFRSLLEYLYFNKMVDVIISRVPNNALELDKVTYISSFVINYLNYVDHGDQYTEFDILLKGSGVCRDYAKITTFLLNKIGVKSECIHSSNNTRVNDNIPAYIAERTPGHEFNIVYVDGKPYFLDNTWEANSDLFNSNYYLVSTDDFLKTHYMYNAVKNYDCPESIPREDIKNSINRVNNWKNNYHINKEQFELLFKQERYLKIEEALDGYKINRGV